MQMRAECLFIAVIAGTPPCWGLLRLFKSSRVSPRSDGQHLQLSSLDLDHVPLSVSDSWGLGEADMNEDELHRLPLQPLPSGME